MTEEKKQDIQKSFGSQEELDEFLNSDEMKQQTRMNELNVKALLENPKDVFLIGVKVEEIDEDTVNSRIVGFAPNIQGKKLLVALERINMIIREQMEFLIKDVKKI